MCYGVGEEGGEGIREPKFWNFNSKEPILFITNPRGISTLQLIKFGTEIKILTKFKRKAYETPRMYSAVFQKHKIIKYL